MTKPKTLTEMIRAEIEDDWKNSVENVKYVRKLENIILAMLPLVDAAQGIYVETRDCGEVVFGHTKLNETLTELEEKMKGM